MARSFWPIDRRRAVAILGAAMFVLTQPVIFFQRYGFLDEIDFWVGAIALAVFALLEVVVFAWIFGIDRGWRELGRGAALRPPSFFKPVAAFLTPAFLASILVWWAVEELPARIRLEGVAEEAKPYVIGARVLIVAILATVFALVRHASRSWRALDDEEQPK